MSKAIDWLEFWAKVGPEMLKLGQVLFAKHDGDTREAIGSIRRMQDHWGKLDEVEAQVDRELEGLREKQSTDEKPEADELIPADSWLQGEPR